MTALLLLEVSRGSIRWEMNCQTQSVVVGTIFCVFHFIFIFILLTLLQFDIKYVQMLSIF